METNPETPAAAAASAKPQHHRLPLYIAIGLVVVLGGAAATAAYVGVARGQVYIEKATLEAPQIPLASASSDILKQVLVAPGDVIGANAVVAQVGTELIKSTVGGLVIGTNNNVGALVAAGTPVVTMIDPGALRVVGQVEEDKGLTDINIGDRATFTVDAFGSRKFSGVVDEISPTSRASDVTFSISDKRETRSFDVKISFDRAAYPELKNGMSARIWVYKN